MKKFAVSFNQTVVKQWVITVDAESAKEAKQMVMEGEYEASQEELLGESDEGNEDFMVEVVED